MLHYRQAVLSDAASLAQLRVGMLNEETQHRDGLNRTLGRNTKAYVEQGIGDGSLVTWVAQQESTIVAMGCACFFALPPNDWCPGGRTAYIGNLYTDPAFRGRGIATRLLSLLLQEAKERQCERLLLNTTEAGRPLYEKFGFESSPTAMAFYPLGISHDQM